MDLAIFFKSQRNVRARIIPHSLVILRLLGTELCSNAFLLMLYWPSKLFKGFDSFWQLWICSNFSLQLFSDLFCILSPSFLPDYSKHPSSWTASLQSHTLILPNRFLSRVLRMSGSKVATFSKAMQRCLCNSVSLTEHYISTVITRAARRVREASAALDSPVQHICKLILHPTMFK